MPPWTLKEQPIIVRHGICKKTWNMKVKNIRFSKTMFFFHLWQETKYFWQRSAVTTWSAETTLSTKPADVPTMFLSLQNLLWSLEQSVLKEMTPNLKLYVTDKHTQWGWTRDGMGEGRPPALQVLPFSPPAMFCRPWSLPPSQEFGPTRPASFLDF